MGHIVEERAIANRTRVCGVRSFCAAAPTVRRPERKGIFVVAQPAREEEQEQAAVTPSERLSELSLSLSLPLFPLAFRIPSGALGLHLGASAAGGFAQRTVAAPRFWREHGAVTRLQLHARIGDLLLGGWHEQQCAVSPRRAGLAARGRPPGAAGREHFEATERPQRSALLRSTASLNSPPSRATASTSLQRSASATFSTSRAPLGPAGPWTAPGPSPCAASGARAALASGDAAARSRRLSASRRTVRTVPVRVCTPRLFVHTLNVRLRPAGKGSHHS